MISIAEESTTPASITTTVASTTTKGTTTIGILISWIIV